MSKLYNPIAIAAGLAALVGCNEQASTEPSPLQGQAITFASITTPEHNEFHEDIDERFSCGTFDITIVGTEDGHETIFFDREGNPARSQGLVKARVTVTNVSTGESLVDKADFMFRVDFNSGIVVNNGKFLNIKDGIRFRDIGRFVFDSDTGEILFEAGPKDQGLGDREPLLCQALS
jgi:hypothetical protein